MTDAALTEDFGIVAITDADRAYAGSRFSDIKKALFENPYQKVWGASGNDPLPRYKVTLRSVLKGITRLTGPYLFRKATERTVNSSADLRWGPDRKGYRRLLHPNGICLTGTWSITEETFYTGYFRKGSKALIVGRYSTCCTETRRDRGTSRSLSMVGKLFPTTDPDHGEPLRTASFITQQDIAGDSTRYLNDADLFNAPNTTALRRGHGIFVLLMSGLVFGKVDKNPTIRQLYQIAELGKPSDQDTRAPTFMRLRVVDEQPRIEGDYLDFRDEVMGQIYNPGDPAPKRKLTFSIEVSNSGITRGLPVKERRRFRDWQKIGTIAFDEAVASYNGDHVIHFQHPTWREDKNDPNTATRIDEERVRKRG